MRFGPLFVLLGMGILFGGALEAREADAPQADREKAPVVEGAAKPAPAAAESSEGAALEEGGLVEEVTHQNDDAKVSKAMVVPSDPVQVYGWKESVKVAGMKELLTAKLDTGALTSSIHATKIEEFERDGVKWVRFITGETRGEKQKRYQLEALYVRRAAIKEPGGDSESRYVVRLTFQIGDRFLRSDFTLKNRENMVCPVLIGRSSLKVLGWVDPKRTHLAEKKLMR